MVSFMYKLREASIQHTHTHAHTCTHTHTHTHTHTKVVQVSGDCGPDERVLDSETLVYARDLEVFAA